MAPDSPVDRLILKATSVADDLGYVALTDMAGVLQGSTYRIIGGQMVTALAARWRLGAELYRETGDTDLGVPPVVVRDDNIIQQLRSRGYEPIAGNRFARTLYDVPIAISGRQAERRAVIDVLVPSYTSRARVNHRVTDDLVTTEVLGLASTIQREPVNLHLGLIRLNGERFDIHLAFPDEVAALGLKASATLVRTKGTDIVDIWRCLEVAYAAGTTPDEFAKGEPASEALSRWRVGVGRLSGVVVVHGPNGRSHPLAHGL
jgi:hypothetical protein